MPNWILDVRAWLTENSFWVLSGAFILADLVGAFEMSKIAYAKGYSRLKHFIICLLFTLLGYLIVIALPDIEQAERSEETLDALNQLNVKLTRVNTRLKKLTLPAKERVPEVVRRLAHTEETPQRASAPSRTRDPEPKSASGQPAERQIPYVPVVAPNTAVSILETAADFETDIGLKDYLRRQYDKADAATKSVLDPLMHLSDESLRKGVVHLLAQTRR